MKSTPVDEYWNATHFNSNRLVAVAIKTTGPDPKIHEIVQICIFPLTSRFELAKKTIPFYLDIKPIKPAFNLELSKGFINKEKYEEIRNTAMLPQSVAELFDSWMENKIRLVNGKRLMVLTHDWANKRAFIKKWLGPVNFNESFSNEYRDIMSLALFCNDYADINNQQIPYPKVLLSFLANILNVEYNRLDDTILHTKAMVEIYREMMRKIVPVNY